jgi:putative oxidoreductase
MKQLFNTSPSSSTVSLALLIARVGFAVLMLTHGYPKLLSLLSDEPVQFPSLFGLSGTASLALAVFAEFFCSILLLIGLATRLAVIPLIVTMTVAAFHIHAADEFSKQEPAIHYLIGYIVLLIAGSGNYSLDNLLGRKRVSGSIGSMRKEERAATMYR